MKLVHKEGCGRRWKEVEGGVASDADETLLIYSIPLSSFGGAGRLAVMCCSACYAVVRVRGCRDPGERRHSSVV